MGQQQLILLALAVIIVGGAIVVGIRAFNENSIKSNADAMMQDAVRISNDAQAWKQKPAPFGGQASVQAQAVVLDPANYTGVSFPLLGYAVDAAGDYNNLNGTFDIVGAATGATIVGANTAFNNQIQVLVNGLSDVNVTGTIQCLGGTDPAGAACTAATP